MKKFALNLDFIELVDLRSAIHYRMEYLMKDSTSTVVVRMHTLESLMRLYDYVDSVIACETNKK